MPTENLGTPEGLTDAERAYFSSGGTDTAALEKEYGTSGGDAQAGVGGDEQQPAAGGTAPAPGAPGAPAAPGAEDDEDGAITIGADGKPRETLSGKYVPHSAMHKERERRKAVESELGIVKERFARGEERLAVLTELLALDGGKPAGTIGGPSAPGAAPKGAEVDPLDEEPIDADEDIFGALKQTQRQNKALREMIKAEREQTTAKEANQSIAVSYRNDALAFARQTPDFGDAYNHLIDSMHAELKAMGIDDEATRNREIAAREKEFVAGVVKRKASPAAALYEVAKVRGYQKKAATAPAPAPAPAPGGKPAADPAAVAKLEAINKAKETVVSLGGSGGGAGGEVLTLETLANMPEAEFEALSLRLGKHKMRAIMGGG